MSEQAESLNLPTVKPKEQQPPGWLFLILAVIFPVFVIGFELYTQMCAEAFFDPMPTLYHKLLVLVVPCSNLLLWWKLRYEGSLNVRMLLLLAATSIGIAGYYTLIFLPLIPVSLIAIIFFGLGFLPFAPLVSLILAIKLYKLLRSKHEQESASKMYLLKGISIALLALILLDLPSSITYFGTNWAASEQSETREKGIKLLRYFGDQDLLLRLSYDGSRRSTGLLSFFILMTTDNDLVSSTKARETFYRVTGEPFNMYPAPYTGRSWSRFDDFRFDPDQGGTQVGGRIKGLNLISSRIDGSVSGDDGVAYLEWILEFKNTSSRPREARLQLALPPESVVSRASLWVHGEEREAAFAGRAKVRQAYERVVRARMDPLLVTTLGTDRILAQAFPIPARGGTIKFKIGITTPLVLNDLETAEFVLPAIVDRNFSIGEKVEHSLWFESKQPLQLNLAGIDNQTVNVDLHRLIGNVSDKELSVTRKVVTTKRDPDVVQLFSAFNENEFVVQSIVDTKPEQSNALLIVIDGSHKIGPHVNDIIESFENIPVGKKVGLIAASGEPFEIELAEWSETHQYKMVKALQNFDFVGGQDNSQALADGIRLLEPYESAELLWIHAPQPIVFEGSSATLEQATSRLTRLPRISLYNVFPGPNKILDDSKWALSSRTIPRVSPVRIDLGNYFSSLFSTVARPIFVRSLTDSEMASATGSNHIARLWAKDQVYSLVSQQNLEDAVNLAANYQLVTTVSGAVVLENQQQYKNSDLSPVGANTVPTIPEPHQWILAFIMVAFILWFLRQNKFALIRPV
jgi:hypothetical protein